MTTVDGPRHPVIINLMRWFEYDHLPPYLRVVSSEFYTMAHDLVDNLPDSPQLTTCLRKLLEAKDCAVRAAVEYNERVTLRAAATRPAPAPEPAAGDGQAAA